MRRLGTFAIWALDLPGAPRLVRVVFDPLDVGVHAEPTAAREDNPSEPAIEVRSAPAVPPEVKGDERLAGDVTGFRQSAGRGGFPPRAASCRLRPWRAGCSPEARRQRASAGRVRASSVAI